MKKLLKINAITRLLFNAQNAAPSFGANITNAATKTAGLGGRRKEYGGYKGGAA